MARVARRPRRALRLAPAVAAARAGAAGLRGTPLLPVRPGLPRGGPPAGAGGGRYVLDTVKGADLGADGDRLIVDFNFAYNPSCAYDPGWACPLAPPANRLPVAVEAGELAPP